MGSSSSSLYPDPLYVIVPLFNHAKFERRYELFAAHVRYVLREKNARLITVELCKPDDVAFSTSLPERVDPRWVRQLVFRSSDVFWAKENLINLGVKEARTLGAVYLGWFDGDTEFTGVKKSWAGYIIDALSHYSVVQPFQEVVLLDAVGRSLYDHPVHSFAYQYIRNDRKYAALKNDNKDYYHPGMAWACSMKAFDAMGGLFEFACVGGADRHFSMSLIGKAAQSIAYGMPEPYVQAVLAKEVAMKSLTMGSVPLTIRHFWHGKLENRKYKDRWQILKKHHYTPVMMQHRQDGLLEWKPDVPRAMLSAIEEFFLERNDDDKPEIEEKIRNKVDDKEIARIRKEQREAEKLMKQKAREEAQLKKQQREAAKLEREMLKQEKAASKKNAQSKNKNRKKKRDDGNEDELDFSDDGDNGDDSLDPPLGFVAEDVFDGYAGDV